MHRRTLFTSLPSLFSSEEEGAEGRASKVNGSKSCFGMERPTASLLAHSLLSSVRLSAKYGAYLYTFENLFKHLEMMLSSLVSIQYSVASKLLSCCKYQGKKNADFFSSFFDFEGNKSPEKVKLPSKLSHIL